MARLFICSVFPNKTAYVDDILIVFGSNPFICIHEYIIFVNMVANKVDFLDVCLIEYPRIDKMNNALSETFRRGKEESANQIRRLERHPRHKMRMV